MFDKARGRFTIMDLQRKVRTEVATDEVLKFTQQLRNWAGQHEDPLLKFCSAPRLEKIAGALQGVPATCRIVDREEGEGADQ